MSPRTLRTYAVASLIGLAVSVAAILATGCRTAGPHLRLESCSHITIELHGDVHAAQGKTVPTNVLTDPTLSASQNGDATSTRDGDSPHTPADEVPE